MKQLLIILMTIFLFGCPGKGGGSNPIANITGPSPIDNTPPTPVNAPPEPACQLKMRHLRSGKMECVDKCPYYLIRPDLWGSGLNRHVRRNIGGVAIRLVSWSDATALERQCTADYGPSRIRAAINEYGLGRSGTGKGLGPS